MILAFKDHTKLTFANGRKVELWHHTLSGASIELTLNDGSTAVVWTADQLLDFLKSEACYVRTDEEKKVALNTALRETPVLTPDELCAKLQISRDYFDAHIEMMLDANMHQPLTKEQQKAIRRAEIRSKRHKE